MIMPVSFPPPSSPDARSPIVINVGVVTEMEERRPEVSCQVLLLPWTQSRQDLAFGCHVRSHNLIDDL